MAPHRRLALNASRRNMHNSKSSSVWPVPAKRSSGGRAYAVPVQDRPRAHGRCQVWLGTRSALLSSVDTSKISSRLLADRFTQDGGDACPVHEKTPEAYLL